MMNDVLLLPEKIVFLSWTVPIIEIYLTLEDALSNDCTDCCVFRNLFTYDYIPPLERELFWEYEKRFGVFDEMTPFFNNLKFLIPKEQYIKETGKITAVDYGDFVFWEYIHLAGKSQATWAITLGRNS